MGQLYNYYFFIVILRNKDRSVAEIDFLYIFFIFRRMLKLAVTRRNSSWRIQQKCVFSPLFRNGVICTSNW